MKYSIVIPTLDERANIVELLSRIGRCGLGSFEVVVVDDHSPDGTLEAVNEFSQLHPWVRGLSNPGERGLSPSIVYGFDQAHGDILCCMDGDLQHDVKDLAGLLGTALDNDFVIGSRYVDGGGFAEAWNPFRVLTSRSAALLARIALGVRVKDPMSGFFAIRRTAFQEIREQLSPRGFKVMLEMLYLLTRTPGSWRIAEYGITFFRRHAGKSKLNCRVIGQYLSMLLQLRARND